MHRILSLLVTCAALHQAFPAFGQSDSAAVRSVQTQPVVVAASRAGVNDPVTTTVIDSAALRSVVVGQDIPYVLELAAPSILAYSESGTSFSNYGTFRLRGIDQTRVNVTLNGAPLNDMIDQGVFFSNLTDVANGMQSIQIQRGVGIAQNGTASFAGAINMESPSLATSQPSARVQLNAGSFGLWRGSIEATTGRTSTNTALYAKLTGFETDGYRYHTGTRSVSAQVGAAWFGQSDVLRLNVFTGRTDNQLGYIPVPKPLADQDPRTNVNDSTDYDDFGQSLVQLDWSRQLSPSAALGVMAYYGTAGGDYFSGFRDSAGVLTQINYPLRNRHVGAMVNATFADVARGLDVKVGVHGYRFWRRNWESVSPDVLSPYYDDRTVKNELSGFATAEYRNGPWTVLANLNLRSVGMQFSADQRYVDPGTVIPLHEWFFANPSIGATYRLNDAQQVYVSAGRTGREPTRFDLLGGTQINAGNIDVVLQPHTVRPEYVTDIELGYRYQSDIASVDVNAFTMFFTDEIAPIGQYIEQWFVQLRKNVAASQRWGVELQTRLQPHPAVTLTVNGTWMRTRIDSYQPGNLDVIFQNVQAVLSPEFLANAQLEVRPIAAVSMRGAVRYASSSWLELTNDPALQLNGFTVVDLAASLHVGRHRISAMLNNVLDERYATNGAVAFDNNGAVPAVFMQAPRNVMLLLELAF